MEEKIVTILNEMSVYLSIPQMKKLQEVVLKTFSENENRVLTGFPSASWDNIESGKFMSRVKAMIPILIPLFVSAFRRAYELSFAMTCRCYHGGEGRTRMKQMKLHAGDFISFGVFVVSLAGVIVLNHYFGRLI